VETRRGRKTTTTAEAGAVVVVSALYEANPANENSRINLDKQYQLFGSVGTTNI